MAIWDLQASGGAAGKSILWRGTWSSATSYNPYDAVYSVSSGSSYFSKTNNQNKIPASNPSDWDLLASVGGVGPQGELGGLPVGTMVDYGGIIEPEGWLWCAGQIIPRTGIYAPLWGAIGDRWGAGDGVTTFQLPDFRGRVSAAPDDMGGTFAGRLTFTRSCNTATGSTTLTHNGGYWIDTPGITSGTELPAGAYIYGPGISLGTYIVNFLSNTQCLMSAPATATASGVTVRFSMLNSLGINGSGGAQANRLNVSQMPMHNHTYRIFGGPGPTAWGGGAGTFQDNYPTGGTGGDQAHDNTQPTGLAYKIIKYTLPGTTATLTPGTGDVTGPSASTDGELAVFNGTTGKFIRRGGMLPSGYHLPRGWLAGFRTSMNDIDQVNDIDIQDGECRDATNTVDIVLPSLMTKRFDAFWSAGTGQGGLDQIGALANLSYHVFVIKNVNTAQVDVLFSPSATNPMLPTGFTHKRRIGSLMRRAGIIDGYIQDGDHFFRHHPGRGIESLTFSTATQLATCDFIPTGITGYIIGSILASTSGGGGGVLMTPTLAPSPANVDPGGGFGPYVTNQVPYSNTGYLMLFDTAARVRITGQVTGTYWMSVFGWIDPRGRNN